MSKILILILVFALAVASIVGYSYITAQINEGSKKIASGQLQLKEGEEMLARGKARLADGQRSFSQVNGLYNGIKSIPLLMPIAKVLPISSQVVKLANSKIAEGNSLIAQGKAKVHAGEKQLAEGKIQLKNGIKRLQKADWVRFLCQIGAVCFSVLFVGLVYYWRRALFPTKK